jgi:hypothetical protein
MLSSTVIRKYLKIENVEKESACLATLSYGPDEFGCLLWGGVLGDVSPIDESGGLYLCLIVVQQLEMVGICIQISKLLIEIWGRTQNAGGSHSEGGKHEQSHATDTHSKNGKGHIVTATAMATAITSSRQKKKSKDGSRRQQR